MMLGRQTLFLLALRANQRSLAFSGFVLLFQAILLLMLPLPVRYALDQIIQSPQDPKSYEILAVATGVLLLLGLTASAFEYLEERMNIRLINRVITQIRQQLLLKSLGQKQSFLDSKRKMDLSSRMASDVQNLETFVVSGMAVAVRAIPSLLFVIAAMLYINLQFAVVVLALMPVFYFLIQFLSKRIKAWEKTTRARQNDFDQDVLQALGSSALIKSINGQKPILSSLYHRQDELNQSTEKTRHFIGLFNSSFSFSRHLLRAVVVGLGGYAILQGQLTIGALFVFVSYLEFMNRPIGEISNFVSRYGKASASLERVEELNRELDANLESGGASAIQKDWELLRLKDLSFGYPNSAGLFNLLNLEFRRGQLVALVGSSGSGKSSYIRLLNRLLDPGQGALLFDQQSLMDSDLHSLRHNVCVIAQDPFFVTASIRDNLTMALQPAPTDEQIWAALKAVNADAFVTEFQKGLSTLIGESGLQISGGQAKRLSLARAFLRVATAQMFVFDEPTSGLDPASAALVMKSIRELSQQNKLVLYSTHRLEEFRIADSVLFFAPGLNPAMAPHEDLYRSNMGYRTLAQAEGVQA